MKNEFERSQDQREYVVLKEVAEMLPPADELASYIENKEYKKLVSLVSSAPAADIAERMSNIPRKYLTRFFRLLPKKMASEVFVLMEQEETEQIINSFSDSELSNMLEELYLDDTVDIIEEMPANVVKRIIKNSTPENRSLINRLLRYPKDSAGTIMTTEYVRFKGDMTVKDALSHIRRVAIDKETIYTCYVTDPLRHLLGIVTAKDLLISPLETELSEIMETGVVYVLTTDDKEEVAAKFEKYGFLALPVVDAESRLVGIVTIDDAIDVIKEEAEEDIAKMAGITPSEKVYLKSSVFSIFRSRIPWLLLLMVSATLSSTILNRFEAALPTVLILFVPMLMDTGGNSGAQASVTLIRSISVGEVEFSDALRVLRKELFVGIMCGVALGTVAFAKVMLVDSIIMSNPAVTLTVGIIIAITLALTVIISKIVGSLLPLLAWKIGFDPAVMASPFITTVVDVLALVVYFFVSKALLGV